LLETHAVHFVVMYFDEILNAALSYY